MRAKLNTSCMAVGPPSQALHGTEFPPAPITPHHPSHMPRVTLLPPCPGSHHFKGAPTLSSCVLSAAPPSHLPINPNLNLYFLGLPNTSAHPEGVNPRPPSPPAAQVPAQHACCYFKHPSAAGIAAAGDGKGLMLGFSGSSSHTRKVWTNGQNQLLQIRKDLRK